MARSKLDRRRAVDALAATVPVTTTARSGGGIPRRSVRSTASADAGTSSARSPAASAAD